MVDKLKKMLVEARIKMYLCEDGADATSILVELSSVIAPICIGAMVAEIKAPWVNQLRGALTTIQDICLNGYQWKKIYTTPLNNALDLALKHIKAPPLWALAIGSEQGMLYAALIKAHQVDKNTLSV